MNPARSALAAMLAGAVLISTTSIFVRLAHVPPTVSGFYRMAFGGGMLLAGLAALRQWRAVDLRTVGWMLFPSAAFALDLWLWHRSIGYVGPGLATLIGNFQVFVMALAGVVLYREHLGWRFGVGVALAFVGLWMLVGRDWQAHGGDFRYGVWLGILTGIAYAAYMLSFRYAQKEKLTHSAAQLLCVNSLLCAMLLAATAGLEGDSLAIPDAQSWAALLALALFGQVLGWVLIARAMPQLPASTVGLLLLLQPLLSFGLDVLLFGRATDLVDWLGVGVSLAGIFVAGTRNLKPARAA